MPTYSEIRQEIETTWNNLIREQWKVPANQYGNQFSIPTNENQVLNWDVKTSKGYPWIKAYELGMKEKPIYKTINKQNFGYYFDDSLTTFNEFVTMFNNLKKSIVKGKHAEAMGNTSASMQIEAARSNERFRERQVNMFSTNKLRNKYSDSDNYFVFDRIYRDSDDNLYMMLNNKLYNLEIKPNTERTLLGNTLKENSQFWPAFFNQFKPDFEKWDEQINNIINTYKWDDATNTSIEELIMQAGVPRIYLECHCITLIERGYSVDNKTYWEFSNAIISLKGKLNYEYKNQVSVLSDTLIQAVDFARVKRIPRFSNDSNEIAIKHLELPICRHFTDDEPTLPEHWMKFFGNGRFVNPLMDKMKIACFVYNTLNASYTGRQVLLIGGEGEDGKGTFLQVLGEIIGTEHTAPMNMKNFTQEDEFGFMPLVNKKFVYLADCASVSKLFSYDKFKSLTGGDAQQINRKFMTPIKFTPTGLTLAINTNNYVFINGEWGMTRCMPLIFKKNFTSSEMVDKHQMILDLLSEKSEFIQWCIDYRAWLNKKTGNKLIIDNTKLICCNDADIENIDTMSLPLLFQRMCEDYQLNGSPFIKFNERTQTEESIIDSFKEQFPNIMAYILRNNKISSVLEFEGVKYYSYYNLIQCINNWLDGYDCPFKDILQMHYPENGCRVSIKSPQYNIWWEILKSSTQCTSSFDAKNIKQKMYKRIFTWNDDGDNNIKQATKELSDVNLFD